MRAGFVVSKKQDLVAQAQIFTSLLGEDATTPEPSLDVDAARQTIVRLNLPERVRARIYSPEGELIGDSFYLSERVDIDALPPLKEPSRIARMGAAMSEWAARVFGPIMPRRSSEAVRTQSFEEEFESAALGDIAASQRFSDRGQRIISVSMPIQRVSAVVGVLTLEASDIDEIIRSERAALVPFIGVAVLVAFITSFFLTLGIARPMRRLSLAADRIRSGASDRIDIPALTRRKDEIGNLASSMQGMTEALLERIEANEQFAADVAHELKNPLTSIRSAIETAERVQDDPVASERLREVIASDVKRLDRLITDISNASRIEAEMTRVPNEQIDIARFARDVVRTYEAMSDGPEAVSVVFEDATMGARLLVRAREGPLGQVIRNLIDNARSFSPRRQQRARDTGTDKSRAADNRAAARGRFRPRYSSRQAGRDIQSFLHGPTEGHGLRQQFRPRPVDCEADHRHAPRQRRGREPRRRRRPVHRGPARNLAILPVFDEVVHNVGISQR